jgi:hypothetical protein
MGEEYLRGVQWFLEEESNSVEKEMRTITPTSLSSVIHCPDSFFHWPESRRTRRTKHYIKYAERVSSQDTKQDGEE